MTNSSAIEVISQQVKALADPAATFAQIEHGLGDLWTAAEQRGDQQTIGFLQVVWDKTVELANTTTTASNVAAAALQTAVEMAETAAKAQTQYEDLVDDLNTYNVENPLIEGILEQHEADLLEWIYAQSDYGAIHSNEPGIDAAENGHFGDMPAGDIEDFLHIVLGDADALPAEMYAEIADFINTMLPAARQHWYEKRAHMQHKSTQRYNVFQTSFEDNKS